MDKKTESVEIRRVADRNLVSSYEIFDGGKKVYEFHALIKDDHFILREGIDDHVFGVCDYGGRSGQDSKTIKSNVENASSRLLEMARKCAKEYAGFNGDLQIKDLSNIPDKSYLHFVDSPQDLVNILTEPN